MKQIIAVFTCLLLVSTSVFAVDPDLDWKTIESEHLHIHFSTGNKALAERALDVAEAAHVRLAKELNWQPEDKTHLVLSDETDQPNGFATPVFFNRTVIFLAPPTSVNTLEDFDDWLTTLIFHEYTHIIHLDKSAGSPAMLRSVFGRMFLLFPNLFQPSWVIEGLATYKETDIDRGVGRGQSTLFVSMMREEVANGLQSLSHVNLPVVTWPAGATRYLYGVYFMQFIAEKYGEDKLQQWVEENSDNLIPFRVNSTANDALGKDLTVLWAEYQQWLEKKFKPQIQAIEAKGVKKGVQISQDAYQTNSVRAIATASGDEVFYVSNGGYKRANLVHVNSAGTEEVLADVNNGAYLDVHPEAGVLLTQNEFCNNYTVYRDIYVFDKEQKKLKRLTKCGRYLFASWDQEGKKIFAVHNNANTFELHLLDKAGKIEEVMWSASNGEILGQIDVSPDGKELVAAKWRRGNGWNLEIFNVEKRSWRKITRGVSITANPQYSQDGNILFSLEANGAYNLHRYIVDTKEVKQLTNLIGGAFQSSQASVDGAIYYSGYTAEGYAIYKLEADKLDTEKLTTEKVEGGEIVVNHSKVETKDSAPTEIIEDYLKTINYDAAIQQESDYSAIDTMRPRWLFPSLELTDQRSEFGFVTSGNDALGIHNYSIRASYDTKLDKLAGQVGYAYSDRIFLSVARINEILLFNGALNRISKRDILSATKLVYSDKKIQQQKYIFLNATFDKTSDSTLASNAVPFEDFEDHLLGVAWLFNSTDKNQLSISVNDGMSLRLVAEDSGFLSSDFSGQIYTIDWRQYIRTGKESVFAIRVLQGWGTDQPRSFKLGGEGFSDNFFDVLLGATSADSIFDHRKYALRGYEEGLAELRGRRARLISAEWRFPLQRLEQGIMAPPVGVLQWSGAVFAETGSAYQNSPDDYYSSAGFEVNADISIFYNLPLHLRLGYAHGFDSVIGDDRVYLKIGSSF